MKIKPCFSKCEKARAQTDCLCKHVVFRLRRRKNDASGFAGFCTFIMPSEMISSRARDKVEFPTPSSIIATTSV